MPEYNCECCMFKTHIKTKFSLHMETSKHLKNMESFVKIEPDNLKERVATLEESNQSLKETIQFLMKRIDALENAPPVY